MCELKNVLMKKLATISKWAAFKAAGSVSCAGMHQPKEPAVLKNLQK